MQGQYTNPNNKEIFGNIYRANVRIRPIFASNMETMRQDNNADYYIERYRLSKMEEKILRPSGCLLMFCEKGQAVISVNFKRKTFRKGDILVLFSDSCLIVEKASRMSTVCAVDISPSLTDEVTFNLSTSLFNCITDFLVLSPAGEQNRVIELWLKQMFWMSVHSSVKHARIMMRNHLYNFFIGMEAELQPFMRRMHDRNTTSVRVIFNRFCMLVLEHCHKQHDVRFYADQLCITPYYLSKITRKIMKISPKELIDNQIILEIKQVLLTTDFSIKEIADRFHFDSPSYLGRYFRRHTGVTPTKFREQ